MTEIVYSNNLTRGCGDLLIVPTIVFRPNRLNRLSNVLHTSSFTVTKGIKHN